MKTNHLPVLNGRELDAVRAVGGGTNVTVSCVGHFGIAPVFVRLAGEPITMIVTIDSLHQDNEVRCVHNSVLDASRWLSDRCCPDTPQLIEIVCDRIAEVTNELPSRNQSC
jgi:hypothetical protein